MKSNTIFAFLYMLAEWKKASQSGRIIFIWVTIDLWL